MRIIKWTLMLSLALIIFSCGDKEMPIEETPKEDKLYKDISIVTGLFLYDEQGNAIGKLGNPNHKHKDELAIFPIPATNVISVGSFDEEVDIAKIFLINATCHRDASEMDLIPASESLEYTDEVLSSNNILEIIPDNNFIQINLEDLEPGFYRFFCKMNDGELYWYNTYIDPSKTNFADLDFYDENCP